MRVSQSVLFALVLSFAACGQTCSKLGGGVGHDDLALVPKDTQIVLALDLARARGTAMWQKLLDVRDSDAKAKADYAEFVTKCGLDPFAQIESLFLAFPQAGPGAGVDQKEFAALVRGAFDEAKLVSCAKEQATKDGSKVTESEYGGHKLYTDGKGGAFATFLDKNTAAVGGAEWIKKIVDLAAKKGQSASANAELATLLKRVNQKTAVWGAGLVPAATREQLKNDPELSAAASMKDVFGSVDFKTGIAADFNVDTGSDADAKALADKVSTQLAATRKNPQVMMLGLASLLDGVKVDSAGPTFRLNAALNQPQVDELIGRVKGLLKSLGGGALGGGLGGPPGGGVVPPSPPAAK